MDLYMQVHRQARGPGQTQVYSVGSCRLQRAASPRLRASLSGTSPKLCQNWVFYATLYLHVVGGRSISIQSNEKRHLADSFRRPLTQPVVQWRMDVINQYLDLVRFITCELNFLFSSPQTHIHTFLFFFLFAIAARQRPKCRDHKQ